MIFGVTKSNREVTFWLGLLAVSQKEKTKGMR